MSNSESFIYHIADKERWLAALASGYYEPFAFQKDGFIHCSNWNQLAGVADRYYLNQESLLVLIINTSLVNCPLKYENPVGGSELFPHIYGPLDLGLVVGSIEIIKDQTGKFIFS